MTLNEIRADLKDIRYYFLRQKVFDDASTLIGINAVQHTVRKYNDAIKIATPQLYDIYVCLYIKNFTQEQLAYELGYTPEHVQRLNKELLLFLQKKIKE